MSKYAYATQRLANYMPPWSIARKDSQSYFQQLLNPIGLEIDDLTRKARVNLNGRFVNTASIAEVDVIYETRLGIDFEIQYDTSDFRIPKPIDPTITVVINDGEDPVLVSVSEDNSIQSFWYDAVPNRLTIDADILSYSSVLDASEIAPGKIKSFNSIYEAGYLYVTIADGTSFIDNETSELGHVKVTGINRRGILDSEVIPFTYNGTSKTLKEWKSLTEIEVINIGPDNATVRIDPSNFNYEELPYYEERHINELAYEKQLYMSSEEISGKTYLDYEVFTANTVNDLLAGVNTKHEVRKVKIVDDLGADITGVNDIALQPDSTRCIVLTDSSLMIYDLRTDYVDGKKLVGRTADAQIQIYSSLDSAIEDDVIRIKPKVYSDIKQAIKYKWDLEKPDGSMVTMMYNHSTRSFDETEYIFSDNYNGWNRNPYEATDPNSFYDRVIKHTIDAHGDYIWTLSVEYLDGSKDIDKRIVSSRFAEPIAVLAHGISNPVGISFNSDYELHVLDNADSIHRVNLHYDTAMISIEDKIVYTREEYFSISVGY